jgi:DNA-binding transcriptional MerR regulator
MASESYTLTEIARRLDVPQHRLIHLCEKGVVIPEVHAATGRGSSRIFSPLNYLELAVALKLRDMFIPVATLRGIIYVLRRFGQEIGQARPDQTLVERLREESSPELRIILSDGKAIYFTLALADQKPTLFGGISLPALANDASERDATVAERGTTARFGAHAFGGPEGSECVRLELSVNAVARSLQLD